jgi:hypothetical protein
LGPLPKYILAIQPSKCIPHFNTNNANCTKNDGEIQGPKSDESQKFPKSTSSLSKKLVSIFADHQAL